MKGRLEDMTVADIIQHNCQDRKAARVEIKHGRQKATLFFNNGNLVHATLGDLHGEDAVYRVLTWEEGSFDSQTEVEAPEVSITRGWSSLLLEGARRLDEAQEDQNGAVLDATLAPQSGSEAGPVEKGQGFLVELADQVEGFLGAAVADLRGRVLLSSDSVAVDIGSLADQASPFVKTVVNAVVKLGAGKLADNLLTTERAYLLTNFLKDEDFFLLLIADNKVANLGSMRHAARVCADHLSTLDFETVGAEVEP